MYMLGTCQVYVYQVHIYYARYIRTYTVNTVYLMGHLEGFVLPRQNL